MRYLFGRFFTLPALACVAIILAASASALLRSNRDTGMRHLVVADGHAMQRDPDAQFVLVRSLPELKEAIRERDARAGKLVIFSDSETGPGLMFDFGERFPAPAALAAIGDLGLAAEVGEYYGQALACLGFDVVLAPTVDLFKGSPVIGWRALGDRLETALPYAETLVRSLAKGGVVPFIKHYPGHGSTAEDSHHSVATLTRPWKEFAAQDLEMFHRLSRMPELGGMMLGHVRSLRGGGEQWPEHSDTIALLSPFWMGLLRQQWGYDGVLVSDALVMKGASSMAGGEGYCSSRFLALGGDLVLGADMVTGLARRAVRLYCHYHQGEAQLQRSEERLDRLWARVRENRQRTSKLKSQEVLERGGELARRVAQRALFASGPWKRPITLSSPKPPPLFSMGTIGKYSDPIAAARAMGLDYEGPFDLETSHSKALLIVFGSVDAPALTSHEMDLLAERVRNDEILGVVVCGWPEQALELGQAGVPAVATWGSGKPSMQAAAQWMQGRFETSGKWPYDTHTTTTQRKLP